MSNKTLSINDDLGNRVEDPKEVKECIIKFCEKMLGTKFAVKKRGCGHREELDQS